MLFIHFHEMDSKFLSTEAKFKCIAFLKGSVKTQGVEGRKIIMHL